MRYIVTPIIGMRGVPYYVVTDSATGKGVEGYGCELWAQHRADALNGSEGEPPTKWIDFLDRVNHSRSRRTAEDHERYRRKNGTEGKTQENSAGAEGSETAAE
jgi:hypothetical protein